MNLQQHLSNIFVTKKINSNLNFKIMKWVEIGYMGVGQSGVPFVDMTSWVDVESPLAQKAKLEIESFIGNFKISFLPKNNAYVPEDVIGKKWMTYYIWRAEQEIPEEVRAAFTTDLEVADWIYKQGLVPLNWSYMAYFMKPDKNCLTKEGHLNFNRMKTPGEWVENAPCLKQWIDSWNLFDVVSRVVIFVNSPGQAVGIHRDFFGWETPQSIHNVSVQFTKDRPGFVFDETTGEKFYFNTQAYCFNVGDNHGVDAQDQDRYTIRVDGVFKPAISKALGLKNGDIWRPDYPSAEKLKNIKIFEPDDRP
jgi:hypothetical protein